jgi:hypothetical protein
VRPDQAAQACQEADAAFRELPIAEALLHLKPGRYIFEVRALNIAGTGPAARKNFNPG